MTFEEVAERCKCDPSDRRMAAIVTRIEQNSSAIRDLAKAVEHVIGLCDINKNLSLQLKDGIIKVSHEIETQLTALQSDLAALSYKPGPSGPFCNN